MNEVDSGIDVGVLVALVNILRQRLISIGECLVQCAYVRRWSSVGVLTIRLLLQLCQITLSIISWSPGHFVSNCKLHIQECMHAATPFILSRSKERYLFTMFTDYINRLTGIILIKRRSLIGRLFWPMRES